MDKRVKINNQIRAQEVRVIDEQGENLGVLSVLEAISAARERGLDLIEISPNAKPPVCKIMDYGKFLYIEKRKHKGNVQHQSFLREVRISLNISSHDMEIKGKKAVEFLTKGDKVKIEMLLKGREKYLDKNFLEERFKRILGLIDADYKITEGPKRNPRGLIMVIEKN